MPVEIQASGQPATVGTSETTPSPIASNLTYRTFGPLTGLDTPVSQPIVPSGTRQLRLRNTYRSDDSISLLDWTLVAVPAGPADIAIVKDTMTYGPAGLLSLRQDAADIESSRFYGYDALLRMTCEARGSGSTQPSSSDCATASSRLAGLYSFGDGQSGISPPDVRITSFINAGGTSGASYTSPSTETYTYSSGSGQAQAVTRTGSNIVIGYDALGRRTFDYNSTDQTSSRRDYTYLPNGQLRNVTGKNQSGQPYSIEVRYDANGRPLMIASGSTLHELFWDDSDRLTASRNGTTSWHYHYLDSSLIAATRVIEATVKRFWVTTDERGLIYRLFDEQGATHWQAQWDATGWRKSVGTPQPNMWVPFALPGQLVFDETSAFTGTSTMTVRPEIILNRWRAYDPLAGAFLQPDPMDHRARRAPEGYTYGRGNPVGMIDYTGNHTEAISAPLLHLFLQQSMSFESCTLEERQSDISETADAILQIYSCHAGSCSFEGGNLRRQFIHTLMREVVACPGVGTTWRGHQSLTVGFIDGGGRHSYGFTFPGDPYPRMTLSWPSLHADKGPRTCLGQIIAHEALHWVHGNTDIAYMFIGSVEGPICARCVSGITIAGQYSGKNAPISNMPPVNLEEYRVQQTTHTDLGGCVRCKR